MLHKFLFTGEDTYSLQQELIKRKQAFLSKYGEQAFFSLAADDVDAGSLLNILLGGGMFASKKLIFLRGVPKDGLSPYASTTGLANIEDALMTHREKIPEDHVLILTCAKPDKRTKARKFFEKEAELKQFTPLKEKDLRALVHSKLHGLVTIDQAGYIVQLVGLSARNIAHECEKLSLYAAFHSIEKLTDEQIEQIVYHQGEINAFGVLDTMFTDKKGTIQHIETLRQQGQDIFQMLGMLYRGLKLVIQMIDCYEQGIKQGKDIASALSVHPFSVNKQIKKLPDLIEKKQHIIKLFRDLVTIDINIKTGRLPAEGFRVALKESLYTMT